jgi:hypothetical protein
MRSLALPHFSSIPFVPSADEIVDVAVEHLAKAPHAIIAYVSIADDGAARGLWDG